ncbi:MAG: ring-cleaving dioxygenase [Bacteroidota bacterium]
MQPIQGLHHITAMARDPQKNVSFYQHVLGQRLVKTTVNFDDPGTYHLYYGDKTGTPGTIMTFFPWPNMVQGTPGAGETGAVAYTIPANALDYWTDRLQQMGYTPEAGGTRFGEAVLLFRDPDNMNLELIASASPGNISHWEAGPVPADKAIHGFHSVTLWLTSVAETAKLLTTHLGYTAIGQEGDRHRFKAAGVDTAVYLDLLETPALPPGRFGAGSVHHIAFRTRDDAEQARYLKTLREAGQQVTPVRDRQYFHSIYFRAPGGVLFEIATDAPGFAYDEPVESLGQDLKLPPWLEVQRKKIENTLPTLNR